MFQTTRNKASVGSLEDPASVGSPEDPASVGSPDDATLPDLDRLPPMPMGVEQFRPTRVGGYCLGRRIGRGGMGEVYEGTADDSRIGPVAVKVARVDRQGVDSTRRLRVEIDTLGRLHHPGIVRLIDHGDLPWPFLVLERCGGRNLADHVSHFQPSLVSRMDLLCRVCEAVAHVHHRGIVHGDLKPENVLVRRTERGDAVKLIDFGLARSFGDGEAEAACGRVRLAGTRRYMSPQRLAGLPVDPRCDVYALGMIAMEWIGHASAADRFSAIVQRAIDPRPDRRHRSAHELAAEIREGSRPS